MYRRRAGLILALCAATALLAAAGCQLPAALGSFGVLAGPGSGDGAGKGDPGASGGGSKEPQGSPNVPIETTGGGLEKGESTLAGKVRLEGRATAEGVKVYLQGDGGHSATILTDQTGDFRFEKILPGTYQLKITKDDYASIDRPNLAVPSDPLDFTLISPIQRIELSAASDSIYPPPPPGRFALFDTWTKVTATLVRSNGDRVTGGSENLVFKVSPADQATLSVGDMMLSTTDLAAPGTLTVTATTRDGAIERQLQIAIGQPISSVSISVVSLGMAEARSRLGSKLGDPR